MHKIYYNGLNLSDFEKEIFGIKKKRKSNKMNRKLGRNEQKYWNFDLTFFIQLYGDLNAFVDSSERAQVDMTHHRFIDVKGQERTQIGMINYILCLIQEYHELHETEIEFTKEEYEKVKILRTEILYNLNIVMPSLWN